MKENLKKFIVSFENMILKRWKTSTFSRFFVKKFLFWPSIFNYLKNELTSRIWFFMWKKTFFWRKNFLFEREKKRKKLNFFVDFLSMIQFIIWKKSLNFRRKWVFKITVGREFLGFLRYESKDRMKRAIDWIKIMKSKCSIMIKIITSKVDLYLFLQRL